MNRSIVFVLSLLFSFNLINSQILNLPLPDKVSALSFSNNGKYIAGSVKKSVKGEIVFLWETSGKLLDTLMGVYSDATVSCLDFSPDNRNILIGGGTESGKIIMWDIINNTKHYYYSKPALYPVNCVSFSPDGKYFVAGTSDKTIIVWSTELNQSLKTFRGHSKSVLTTAFHPNGKYLYSGSKDNKIIQWDFETGENIRTLLGSNSAVNTICITPDGHYLICGSDDGIIYMWDLLNGSLMWTILGHEAPVTSVCCSPDGNYIISSSEDKTARIFELSSGINVRSYQHPDKINTIDISPDSKIIATGSDDKSIKLWYSNLELTSPENKSGERKSTPVDISPVPDIIWQIPVRATDTANRKDYTVHAYIQSKSQLKSVSIFHNSLTREYDLTTYRSNSTGGYNLALEHNLLLDNGNNSIIIKAVNDAGSTTSEIRSVYFVIPAVASGNEVVWETPSKENEITNSENLKVIVCIKSKTKITQISLYLNNNLWTFEKTGNIPPASVDCMLKFEKEVNLQKGNNEIKIEAINMDNSKIIANRNVVFQEYKVEKRLALVIGNSKYIHGEFLLNPVNDALAMAKALESVGFDVETYTDADQKTIKMAMDKFGDKLENYQIGLFYYAGHGVQVNGNNYIIPVDANLYMEQDVEYDCVEVGRLLGKMEGSGCETNIIILDACRDNPFERRWGGRSVKTQGLAFMNAPSGSIIAYSTAPGKTASDGTSENGLYTGILLKNIKIPDLQIEDVFKNVRSEIEEISDGKQTPWESTSLKGRFYFIRETSQPELR